MLARTLVRAPELGLRRALGASRLQLVRQLMTESLLLASIGGATGVLLGRWALDGVLTLVEDLPPWIQLQMDWRFVSFICAAVALCAAVAGLVPAGSVVLRRLDLRGVLGPGAQRATAPGSRVSSLRALVAGEIALALVLLLAAGLFGRALVRVMQIEPGIRPERVLTYGLLLPEAKYRSSAERLAFFDQHLARLRALPDVQSPSASTILPFSDQHIGNFLEPEGGLPGSPDASPPVILTRMSFPGYFETMGIPLRTGRSFREADRANVVIVNETMARLFWPAGSAVGKRVRSVGGAGPWLDVIGVAGDIRHYGLEGEIRPGIYVPFHAMPQSFVGIVIRTNGDPLRLAPDVRSLLKEQDPTLPLAGLATMEERIGRSLFLRRAYSSMTATFALVALAMAMTGLYGIIAYVAGQRTREFGVRLALGAQARDLRQAVVREGVRLAAVGIGIGIAGGILAGLALRPLLVGVSPLDPVVLLGATALLVAIVLGASLAPAIRAARLNAVDVLRAE